MPVPIEPCQSLIVHHRGAHPFTGWQNSCCRAEAQEFMVGQGKNRQQSGQAPLTGISSAPCSRPLLSLNRITFLLPKINLGAFPHCQGEEFEFSTKGSRHPLGHLLTCLLMEAVPWASTGSNLVVVSASAHLFFELSSHPFFLADPF